MEFNQLNLITPLKKALAEMGYSTPTEIQCKTIPLILKGRDVLGCAQTGTGKTAAFALPIIQHLNAAGRSRKIRSLVLTPTRELALQIEENFNLYAKYLPVKCLAIFGGVPQHRQVAGLKKGVDVLVATPGRLQDLMQQGIVRLDGIEILVLDEADHMLDIGFINDIKRIIARVPAKRQTLFFSATMPEPIRRFGETILHKPAEVSVNAVSSTADLVHQSVYFVDKNKKTGLLVHLLKDNAVPASLVFTRTKHGADRLARQLSKSGIHAAAIHGNKSQNARQKALSDFKRSKIKVLVATDIASRGIDIDHLPFVVNYELPNVPETYVHRIGRTGRAGRDGTAVSFCDDEQRKELRNIQKLIGFKIPVVKKAESLNN